MKYFALLREILGVGEEEYELEDGATLYDLLLNHIPERHRNAAEVWRDKIRRFLHSKLKLELSKCDLFPVSRGVDFLGYRHFPKYILVRKSTAKRIRRRLKRLPELLAKGRITVDQFRSSLASTMGWLKWVNTYNLRKSLRLDELQEILSCA